MKSVLDAVIAGHIADFPEFPSSAVPGAPLRGAILTHEELASLAEVLAERHHVRRVPVPGTNLFARIRENRALLEEAYFTFAEAARNREPLPPGAEWLLDNYYVVQEHAREVRTDLPRAYYRKLPKLKRGEFRGYPRVLHLACEFVCHTDSVIDETALGKFIGRYQEKHALTLGELWAVPIMLRFALLENLRRLTMLLVRERDERAVASELIEELLADSERTSTEVLLLLARELREYPDTSITALLYLIRALQEKGPKAALAVSFLVEKLRERDLDVEEVTRSERNARAADQISIVNSLTSLRTVARINWKEWVERQSAIESILRRDPAGVHGGGDFATRDRYRQQIEVLAARSRRSETRVAEQAVELAAAERGAAGEAAAPARAHVGYYLVGPGRPALERAIGYRAPLKQRIARFLEARAFRVYAGAIAALTLVLIVNLLGALTAAGAAGLVVLAGALLFFAPASEFASNIVQWLVTIFVAPRPLPKLDLSRGIPPEGRTLVAVHGIFTDVASLERAVHGLEVRYIGNRDPNLFFALLADFADAPREELETDAELQSRARALIDGLNAKYGAGTQRFLVLFRRRRWNPGEGRFMGWERKRGKIHELNELIRGSATTSFIFTVGAPQFFESVRYVITLDLDTQLPRGAAHKLVGTIMHPMNRAVVDRESRVVVEGYGVIQPRVGVSLPSAAASYFSSTFTGRSGIDPYTHCVSDVYQDVFSEGSYIGKAIYDVEAFEQALGDRVPENALLSHDLFEGIFARAGLASDIELLDDFPSRYSVFAKRQHRWVRGDWQLLPWIFRRVPGRSRERYRSPIGALGRWKLVDNLRRSVVAPSMFAFLLLAWAAFPANAGMWSALIVLFIAFPVFANLANALTIPDAGLSFKAYVRGVGRDVGRHLVQATLTVSFLPYQAFTMVHAIAVTLYRMAISKRRLLEWESAFHAEQRSRTDLPAVLAGMAPGLVLTIAAFAAVAWLRPDALPPALPFVALWLGAPLLAFLVSLPAPAAQRELAPHERTRLRTIAWQTWTYFSDLMNERNNYLVPDNIQLVPAPVVAFRTSPTNISLSLLSTAAAYDLGFVTLPSALRRLARSFESLARMERFNGHFLNWYSTERLDALAPKYVSTVDSGNLCGHLIALRTFLLAAKTAAPVTAAHREHFAELVERVGDPKSGVPAEFRSRIAAFAAAVQERANAPLGEWLEALRRGLTPGLFPPPSEGVTPGAADRLKEFVEELLSASDAAHEAARGAIDRLVSECERYVKEADFKFLFRADRHLFAIGYNVDIGRLDDSSYDLLASEARLASLVAIAKGEIDEEHWFRLGRLITDAGGGRALLSWAGTMFEYLMPTLVVREYPGTILAETNRAVVKTQARYARRKGVPWGFSESGYSGVDFEKTYQYKAFGVPGLGLKRGLGDEIVVSPYSTFLALQVSLDLALANLPALEAAGLHGPYGFFESIDYTPTRLGRGEQSHVVQSFLAHHQGMTLLAITNVLCDQVFQHRFHADPAVQSVEVLLQEQFPTQAPSIVPHQAELTFGFYERELRAEGASAIEQLDTPHTDLPRTHLLSNGRYSVMVDNAGSGMSWLARSVALTRWREDALTNDYGTYLYVRDGESGELWSAAYQPVRREPERYEVFFSPDKAEFKRRDEEIGTHTEITISPEDDVEIRRVTLTNFSGRTRRLELTSYGEVVIAPFKADAVHPAFSNLFVSSEFIPELDGLLFERRKRSREDRPWFLFHVLSSSIVWARTQYESSRMNFLGRGGSVHEPAAFAEPMLRGGTGSVLDPIFSLRAAVELEAYGTHSITFITGAANDRDEALRLMERYHRSQQAITRAFEMSWSQSNIEMRMGQYHPADSIVFQRLANALFFDVEGARTEPLALVRNRLTQSGLWRFGISGDQPIVLVRVTDPEQLALVKDSLVAHDYLRQRGLSYDLVILNEYPGGYQQLFQQELEFTVRAGRGEAAAERPGGIFIRGAGQLSPEEIRLLEAVSRVVLTGPRGRLAEQVPEFSGRTVQRPYPARRRVTAPPPAEQPGEELEFFNGTGGFGDGGRTYVMQIGGGKRPPLPWSNVVADAEFGFLVTESGGGYTWSENSRENRLTPWRNDPVADVPGEAIFIRDVESGRVWCPTPRPIDDGIPTRVEHGFGYTLFSRTAAGIASRLEIALGRAPRTKEFRLRLANESEEARTLEVLLYCEWVLGVLREESYRHLASSFDPASHCLFAVNNYNNEFAGRLAYVGADRELTGYTADRREFLGRNRDLAAPLALDMPDVALPIGPFGGREELELQRRTGAGFDSAGVIKVTLTIEAGEEGEAVFFLGEARSVDEMRQAAAAVRSATRIATSRRRLPELERVLSAVTVETPDRSFDILMNGWLLHQTLSCRVNGRSGFYQSGGAIGFRDQLQDVLALVYGDPQITRRQILLHAARQFTAGDVQHWWHPPTGRGVRTLITDDLLWLPFAVDEYIERTGDAGVLDEEAPFIEGMRLEPGQADAYYQPNVSIERATVYEHCLRTIDRSLEVGPHGLPLIGGGDWNDGMNEVGIGGRGESVWLGWFLALVLEKFSRRCEARGDAERSARYREARAALARALETAGWDGRWYRRAYFDDGTPLGSAHNDECQIDSLSQTWSVISGLAPRERAAAAMESVLERLVREEDRLIVLLDPPFDRGTLEPGYIKGYPPGIRENGAQYTHAATWVVLAAALLGRGTKAMKLFELLNPVNHTRDAAGVARYQGEPYVLCGDVYSRHPHAGRAGWSWYTGSSGWLYRVGLEALLGLRVSGDGFRVDPCIPAAWNEFTMTLRRGDALYRIEVRNPGSIERGVRRVEVNGEPAADGLVRFDTQAAGEVLVTVTMGA